MGELIIEKPPQIALIIESKTINRNRISYEIPDELGVNVFETEAVFGNRLQYFSGTFTQVNTENL